jgi:hypothetical protein
MITALASMSLCGSVVAAQARSLAGGLVGTYTTDQKDFVTVKRLTFSEEKDGSIKIRGALVGFPDEVSIGEAVGEPYAARNDTSNPDTLLASFSSEKYKPLLIISPQGWDGKQMHSVNFTCYMRDIDGSKVHIQGHLNRQK